MLLGSDCTHLIVDFLNIARTADDLINTRLNALRVPNLPTQQPRSAPDKISESACHDFVSNTLLRGWESRDRMLSFCETVASQDTGALSQTLPTTKSPYATTMNMANYDKPSPVIVDQRLDPYSGRAIVPDTQVDVLKRVIRQERAIENVVRERSVRVIRDRCETEFADQLLSKRL